MVSIENLSFNYSRHIVFKEVTMKLEEGKIYGLLGQNGVGKTTLLKIISGLLKPQNGKVDVLGHNPYERVPEFLSDIYFLPEEVRTPDIKVRDYALSRGQFYPKFDIAQFERLLADFDVCGDIKFNSLSYGQQKKAMIAFALSVNTSLILMDEPSNGLDIPSKTQLRKVIAQSSNDNVCIVISTHQVRDLENLIDPIIILDRNAVLMNASIDEISEKLFFGFSDKENKDALYSEMTLGGYLNVEENTMNKESKVNIEALFNATLYNKEKVKKLFTK